MKYKFAQYLADNRIDPKSVRPKGARSEVWQAWFKEAVRRWKIESIATTSRRLVKAGRVPASIRSEFAALVPGSPEASAFILKHKPTLLHGHH
ncbi:MAG: hypothetical protein DVB31_09810 [Verrucomicrobia bacterium]|nr:MAG: hypothetical protein DVB31_09810 [Verrucomicrobiota bacterium]